MEKQENVENFRFIVEGICLVMVGLTGLGGNVCGIIWFSTKRIQKKFHQLMLSLAICDFLFVLLIVLLFGIPNIFAGVKDLVCYKYMFPVGLPLAEIGMTGSIYFTLAIAVERYTTVCHPFSKIFHVSTTCVYICLILLFSVVYNIPKFFEFTVVNIEGTFSNKTVGNLQRNPSITSEMAEDTETIQTVIESTALRRDPVYIKGYLIYSNLFIRGIIPFFLLVILNTAIYRQIRQLRNYSPTNSDTHRILQREIRLAQVSLGIVAVFIACHSVKWVPNIWELIHVGDGKLIVPTWLEYVTCLSHLLLTVNSSVNVYIYFFNHRRRRQNNISRKCSLDLDTNFTELKRLSHHSLNWSSDVTSHLRAEEN